MSQTGGFNRAGGRLRRIAVAGLALATVLLAVPLSAQERFGDRQWMSPPVQDPAVRQADYRAAPLPAPVPVHPMPTVRPEPVADPITGAAPGRDGWVEALQDSLSHQFHSLNWQRMLTSLGLVVGGYLAVVLLFRTIASGKGGRLPSSVFELVGSTRLNARQSLQLVRVGSRLLMLIVSPEGAQAVGEISHPGEVETLVSMCDRRARRRPVAASDGTTAFVPAGATRGREGNQSLEQLAQALQQAMLRTSPSREFEA